MVTQIHSVKTLKRNKDSNNHMHRYLSRINCVKPICLPSVRITGFAESEAIEAIVNLSFSKSLDRHS